MKLAEASMQAAHRSKRKTINYADVLSAVQGAEEFDFLEAHKYWHSLPFLFGVLFTNLLNPC